MRAAIYNPYLDTLGGGERYTMAFANALIQKGYEVDVEWKDESIKEKLEDRFGIKLLNVKFVKDVKKGDAYDLMFWVSDGSIPLLYARKNILHFQVPFTNVSGRSLLNKMKLFRINKIICNSIFTKTIIDKEFGVKSIVIYPPVDIEKIKPKRKENLIISVGRFSNLLQAKRQDILVECFKKIKNNGNNDWKLVLAGGADIGGSEFIQSLKKSSKNASVEILEGPSFNVIKGLFGRAKIFWSASGYGVDEAKTPSKVEHFGISVVEAMGAGAVPIVYSAGGHKEIITDNKNGFLWSKTSQLITKTLELINNEKLLREIQKNSIISSKIYDYGRFEKAVSEII